MWFETLQETEENKKTAVCFFTERDKRKNDIEMTEFKVSSTDSRDYGNLPEAESPIIKEVIEVKFNQDS